MKRQLIFLLILAISPFLSGYKDMDTSYRIQNIPAQTIRFNSPSQQKSSRAFSCQPRLYRNIPHFSLPKTATNSQPITKETFAAITTTAQKYGAQLNQKIVKDLEKTVCEQATIGTIFCKQKQTKFATTVAHFCFNVLDLMKLLVENGTKKTAQFVHDQKTNLIATVERCVDYAQKIMFEIGEIKPFPLFTGDALWHENLSIIRSEIFERGAQLTTADAASLTFSSLLSNYSPIAACLFSLAHFLGSIASSLPPTLPPFSVSAAGLASVTACVTPAQLVVAGVGISLIFMCNKKNIKLNSNKIDLIGHRKEHILNRHKFGVNKKGKSEFPKNWDDEKIIKIIHDIAMDPKSIRGLGKWESPYAIGIRDGIKIRVDFYPESHPLYSGKISTAYPVTDF